MVYITYFYNSVNKIKLVNININIKNFTECLHNHQNDYV